MAEYQTQVQLKSLGFVTLMLVLVGSLNAQCITPGCDLCSGTTCTSCRTDQKYFPQITAAGACEPCPTGCDNCNRSGGKAICTKCTDAASYPTAGGTTCQKCPDSCTGCYLVNNTVSCTVCKAGYKANVNGLIKTCSGGLAWWAWLLIAIGIALVLGAIIAGIVMSGQKKPEMYQDQMYGQQGYEMNQSMDQSQMYNNGQQGYPQQAPVYGGPNQQNYDQYNDYNSNRSQGQGNSFNQGNQGQGNFNNQGQGNFNNNQGQNFNNNQGQNFNNNQGQNFNQQNPGQGQGNFNQQGPQNMRGPMNNGYSENSPMMSNTNTPANVRNASPQRFDGNNGVTGFNPNGSNMKPDSYSDQNTAFSNKYDAVIDVEDRRPGGNINNAGGNQQAYWSNGNRGGNAGGDAGDSPFW